MSTLQQIKMPATTQEQNNQMKNWEAIFPAQQVTEQKSALFVKKLLAVAISNITYLRNIFPEKAFGDKCLDSLNLKILRDESTCPGACQVIKWVKGCFDALDKKYLKTLVIGIYENPEDPDTVIESYTFKFSYDDDGSMDIYRNEKKISGAYSAEETRKATIKLLRTLVVLTNTLSQLPDNVMMTMKIFYYDEVTPKDYEPPGFKAAPETLFNFTEEAKSISIGSVSTAFHTVKLRIKKSKKEFDMDEEGEKETNSTDIHISDEGLDKEKDVDANLETQCDQSDLNSAVEIAGDAEDFKVRCPCGCNEDDGIMIMCGICKFWQHGACFLITNGGAAPEIHICDICAKPNDPQLKPTDPQLCGLTSIDVQGVCLWRRVLYVINEFKTIVTPQLAQRLNIEHTVAQGLINRLEKEGYVSTHKARGKKKELGKLVNKEKIETEGIPKYLQPPKDLQPLDDTVELMDCNTQGIDKDISMLTDDTKKINIGGRKSRRSRNSPQVDSQKSNTTRRANKRTRAKDIDNECLSQEDDYGSSKKASKVNQDIVLKN